VDRKAKDDLVRLVKDVRQFGEKASVMTFEEAVAEGNAKSGDKVQINLLIGPWRPNARCCPQGGEAMGANHSSASECDDLPHDRRL
jgi:hypothetical protein